MKTQTNILNKLGDTYDHLDYVTYFHDFMDFPVDDTTGNPTNFTIVQDAAVSPLSDGVGGWIAVGATNTDNNETYFSSLNECFKFQTNKKLYFETKIKLTEANTNASNWIIGLSDTVGINSLLDGGAGPMASYDGAVFFKVDGTMKIQFETSNAATQVTNATLATFVSATEYKIGFIYDYNDGVTAKVTPFVNGVQGTTHNLTISGLEEMHILMGVKAGSANAETLLVDYVKVVMER